MSEDLDLVVGARIRRRRRLMGLTQRELGELCGVRVQQIQKYECAANRLSAAMIWRLAEALQVSTDYFFEGLSFEPHGEETS